MNRITPLVVSGTLAIQKTAFSARLVREHPDMFRLSAGSHLQAEAALAHQENKIPIFHQEVTQADDFKSVLGTQTVNSVFIMPPNIQSLRQNLESAENKSQVKIESTIQTVKKQVEEAYKSTILRDEDFIFLNNDFEKAYQHFKRRVFQVYGETQQA